MSDDKIYFYNNTYYTEDDLKSLPRHTRFSIRHYEEKKKRQLDSYYKRADHYREYNRNYKLFQKQFKEYCNIQI